MYCLVSEAPALSWFCTSTKYGVILRLFMGKSMCMLIFREPPKNVPARCENLFRCTIRYSGVRYIWIFFRAFT